MNINEAISPYRLEKITDYILAYHPQKTKSPDFTAMFCVSSVETLIKYYDLFKQKQIGAAKPLKIATIFSYAANEEDPNANGLTSGLLPEENPIPEGKVNQRSRDKLDEFIEDYNGMFGTKYSILDMLAGEVQLRSKRKLIETFIEDNLPKLKPDDNVIAEFETYWTQQRQKAFEQLCADEKIEPANFDKLLQNYVFANRLPRDQEIVDSLSFKPKILERKTILERIGDKIQAFIHTYVEGMGGSV